MREHNESLGRPIWSRNWLQIDLLSIFSSTHAVTSLRKTDSCLRGRGKKKLSAPLRRLLQLFYHLLPSAGHAISQPPNSIWITSRINEREKVCLTLSCLLKKSPVWDHEINIFMMNVFSSKSVFWCLLIIRFLSFSFAYFYRNRMRQQMLLK